MHDAYFTCEEGVYIYSAVKRTPHEKQFLNRIRYRFSIGMECVFCNDLWLKQCQIKKSMSQFTITDKHNLAHLLSNREKVSEPLCSDFSELQLQTQATRTQVFFYTEFFLLFLKESPST